MVSSSRVGYCFYFEASRTYSCVSLNCTITVLLFKLNLLPHRATSGSICVFDQMFELLTNFWTYFEPPDEPPDIFLQPHPKLCTLLYFCLQSRCLCDFEQQFQGSIQISWLKVSIPVALKAVYWNVGVIICYPECGLFFIALCWQRITTIKYTWSCKISVLTPLNNHLRACNYIYTLVQTYTYTFPDTFAHSYKLSGILGNINSNLFVLMY